MKRLLSFIIILFTVLSVILSCPTVSAQAKFRLNCESATKSVTLNWNNLKEADCYRIYRKTANAKYTVVCKNTDKLKFTDKKLKSGKEYTYKVKAFKKSKNDKLSGLVSVSETVRTKKPIEYKNSYNLVLYRKN